MKRCHALILLFLMLGSAISAGTLVRLNSFESAGIEDWRFHFLLSTPLSVSCSIYEEDLWYQSGSSWLITAHNNLGISKSIDAVSEAGIEYFGTGTNQTHVMRTIRTNYKRLIHAEEGLALALSPALSYAYYKFEPREDHGFPYGNQAGAWQRFHTLEAGLPLILTLPAGAKHSWNFSAKAAVARTVSSARYKVTEPLSQTQSWRDFEYGPYWSWHGGVTANLRFRIGGFSIIPELGWEVYSLTNAEAGFDHSVTGGLGLSYSRGK